MVEAVIRAALLQHFTNSNASQRSACNNICPYDFLPADRGGDPYGGLLCNPHLEGIALLFIAKSQDEGHWVPIAEIKPDEHAKELTAQGYLNQVPGGYVPAPEVLLRIWNCERAFYFEKPHRV